MPSEDDMSPHAGPSTALIPFKRKRSHSPTSDQDDARSPPKRKHKTPSTIDWDKAILTLHIGSRKSLFRLDAGTFREKSYYFAQLLGEDWNESFQFWLHFMEPREFKIYKDWIYGRHPRWFEHYMHGSREGAAEDVELAHQWPAIRGVKVNAWKSRYCHHLCLLWLHGYRLGEEFRLEVMNRLTNITLNDSGRVKRVITTDEPDWTDTFVMAPSTLDLIYSSLDEGHAPLHQWATEVIASRLDTDQLHEFSQNELPDGFMSAVYQTKLWLTNLAHKYELQYLHRELQGAMQSTNRCARNSSTKQKTISGNA